MLKLFYTLLTDPLGLPIEPLWEYVILLIVGEIVHEIAWNASPGGTFGSLIYGVTKLLAFVIIWAVIYGVIAVVKWICANWVLVLCILGAIVVLAATISIFTAIHKKKTKKASVEEEK